MQLRTVSCGASYLLAIHVFTVCPSTVARPKDLRNVDFPDMFEPVINTP
jgi:hypothetical protein